jgi:hypothetical protein
MSNSSSMYANEQPKMQKRRGRKSILDGLTKPTEDFALQTFHYSPSEECSQALAIFAKEHCSCKNKQFKSDWEQWIQDARIQTIINAEVDRLVATGYKGDPMEKMYASARYYYRKKALKEDKEMQEPENPKQRKKYEAPNSLILDQMNKHILEIFTKMKSSEDTSSISPAKAFEMYIQENDTDDVNREKFKKMYKNRLFLLRNKIIETH